jgi:hypothetical protein
VSAPTQAFGVAEKTQAVSSELETRLAATR